LRSSLLVGAAALLLAIGVAAALESARLTNWTGWVEPRGTSANQAAGVAPMTGPAIPSPPAKSAVGPVKVFILAGDYSMSGTVKVSLLKSQANQTERKERFRHLFHDGQWVVREDVWIKNFYRKGNLTVGFGQTQDHFGPELEFGHVVGDHFDEQVLLIKTCYGESLGWEFRPPSAGLPAQAILENQLRRLQTKNPNTTLTDVEKSYGAAYRGMLRDVQQPLANLGKLFPSYQGQGWELAGFVWFQAWADMIDPDYNRFYIENLAHFIRDVRRDLKAPHLPFVIGQLGVQGASGLKGADVEFRAAQASVAQLPEFRGNVKLVATDPFWDHEAHAVYKKLSQKTQDEFDRAGCDAPFRYLGSPKTICQIGRAFGEAMIELRRSVAKN
jgi:alpha-galactosidase